MNSNLALSEEQGFNAFMSITGTLRKALADCGKNRHRVSLDTGIPESTLSRFHHGKPLRGENIDKLCKYLGLELTPKADKPGKGR